MKLSILLFILMFSEGVLSADPSSSVSSKGDRSKGNSISSDLSREKNMSLIDSYTNSEIKAIENISTKIFSKSKAKQFSFSNNLPASVLITPFITAIERGELDVHNKLAISFFRQCALYTSAPPTPNAVYYGLNQVPKKHRWVEPLHKAPFKFVKGLPAHPSTAQPIAEILGVRSASIYNASFCYAFYGEFLKNVVEEMASYSIYSESKRGFYNNYVLNDLNHLVASSIIKLLDNKSIVDFAKQTARIAENTGCSLPSLQGLQDNNLSWRCGGLSFDSNSNQMDLSGTTLLGDNTFGGVTAVFSQIDSVALAQDLLKANASSTVKSKDTSKAKSISLAKKITKIAGVSSDKSRSGSAGTN